jgi:hypothetical protein
MQNQCTLFDLSILDRIKLLNHPVLNILVDRQGCLMLLTIKSAKT